MTFTVERLSFGVMAMSAGMIKFVTLLKINNNDYE